MKTLVLQNKTLKLEFSQETGALVGLTAVQTGWKILDRPEIGLSFRLMLPLEEQRNNPVFGEKQKVSSIRQDEKAGCVTFVWDKVNSEYAGEQDVKVAITVSLTEKQAVYETTIENRSASWSKTSTAPTWAMCSTRRMKNGSRPSSTTMPRRRNGRCGRTYDNLRGYLRRRLSRPSSLPGAPCAGRADVALHPAARRRSRGCMPACAAPAPSWWPGTPSCAPATAARSTAACPEAPRHRRARRWQPASPPCTCPISSPARRAP